MDELERALRALDEALAAAPGRDGQAFSAAVECLAQARARMFTEDGRTPAGRARLERLNGIISLVLAGHFPLGEPPWAEIRKARGWLAELAGECQAGGA